jgi:hypothetical protein
MELGYCVWHFGMDYTGSSGCNAAPHNKRDARCIEDCKEYSNDSLDFCLYLDG